VSPAPQTCDDLKTLASPALAAISANALSAHVRFLSDDLLEGRGTGTPGFDRAAHYVATELQSFGVAPAGEGGTYFQSVPLRAFSNDQNGSRFALTKASARLELAPNDDAVLVSDGNEAKVDVSAPIVFVGYGIAAPEYHYDDLAGVDLKGKIALVLNGAPPMHDGFFTNGAHAYYADSDNKVKDLIARGAVGMIRAFTPASEQFAPWSSYVRSASFDAMDWMEGDHVGLRAAGAPARAVVSSATLRKILSFSGSSETPESLVAKAEKGQASAFDLGVTATLKHTTTFRQITSTNVVGMIRGSDPSLANEYVVYSAHLDHLGVGPAIDGDAIYNGALDNASGVATLLEIARAFAAIPSAPRRSIVFVFFTAEEPGALGSEYFAAHPTMKDGPIVCDINVDGNLPPHEVLDVVPLGADQSTLAKDVSVAASALGLAATADDDAYDFFSRSDEYGFAKRGVPSIFMWNGDKDARGETKANEALDGAFFRRYHTPKDEWDPSLGFGEAAKMARVDLLVGLSVARAAARPAWKDGAFYSRFKR
jgi:Zn-dependent M28 family amino/carboxypeptidase